MAEKGHSEACCNIPPVVSEGYQPKGKYEDIGGFKTYVTGPPTATKAILYIFDIFGYFPQSIQGADILSTSSNTDYLVFMPDFFHGKAADITWFPPQNDEHKAKLNHFFANQGAPPTTIAKIPQLLEDIEKRYDSVKEWGVLGFCWGGKVVSLLTSGGHVGEKLKVAGECHPAFVSKEDAKGIKVPLILLASKDEDVKDVKEFEEALTVEHHVETFGDQIHGWMAARSDLSDDKVKAEYERGYKTVLEFFNKYL